jgi:hypothetical protein
LSDGQQHNAPIVSPKPAGEFGPDEWFHAFASGEAQPETAVFPPLEQVNVEKQTAPVLLLGPFCEHTERSGVVWELELVSIGEFANRYLPGS